MLLAACRGPVATVTANAGPNIHTGQPAISWDMGCCSETTPTVGKESAVCSQSVIGHGSPTGNEGAVGNESGAYSQSVIGNGGAIRSQSVIGHGSPASYDGGVDSESAVSNDRRGGR
jgi:hypothetical protein